MYDSEDVIIILKSCDNPLLWEHGKGNAVSPILSRVKLNKRQVIAMVVFVTISSAAQMVSPTLVSIMIDGVSNNDQTTIIYLAIAIIVLALVACATNVVATNLASTLTTKFSANLRKELFRKVV